MPELVAAFHLSKLVTVRVRAWVNMTLAAHGPIPQAQKREEDDWILARERFEQAQTFDVFDFRTKLEAELARELGSYWDTQPVAKRLRNRLVEQQAEYKNRAVEDFYEEVSSFMRDVYTLQVETCTECISSQAADRQVDSVERALPPFHLACTCKVRWKHRWTYDSPGKSGPYLDSAIQDWLYGSKRGLSVCVPSIRDLINFEKARMLDESSESAVCAPPARPISNWRRFFSFLSRS